MGGAARGAAKRPLAEYPGLQAERTDLAWTRSSLAFLADGALLLVRPELYAPSVPHLVVAAIAFSLALFAALMAHQRRRVLAMRPLPQQLASPAPLCLLGAGAVLLSVLTLILILLD